MSSTILKYFAFAHLSAALQAISKPIGELAAQFDAELPDSAEKSAGLRKLLEAKDCFVRAKLDTLDVPKPDPPVVVTIPVSFDVLVDGPDYHGRIRTKRSLAVTPNWILALRFPGWELTALNDRQVATMQTNCGGDFVAGTIGTVDPAHAAREKRLTDIVGICFPVRSYWRDPDGKLRYVEDTNWLPDTIASRYTTTGAATGPASWEETIKALEAGALTRK